MSNETHSEKGLLEVLVKFRQLAEHFRLDCPGGEVFGVLLDRLCDSFALAATPAVREPGPTRERFHQRHGAYLNTMVADLHIEGKGQYLRDLFGRFEDEMFSSSSAGPTRLTEEQVENILCSDDIYDINDEDVDARKLTFYINAALLSSSSAGPAVDSFVRHSTDGQSNWQSQPLGPESEVVGQEAPSSAGEAAPACGFKLMHPAIRDDQSLFCNLPLGHAGNHAWRGEWLNVSNRPAPTATEKGEGK